MNEGRPRFLLVFLSALVACHFWASDAAADGFDVAWFVTRVPGSFGTMRGVLLAGLLLLLDYALNILVIAWPAAATGVPFKMAARELIGFTVFAQIADRLGMCVCVVLVLVAEVVAPGRTTMASIAAGVPYMLVLNFLTSGAFIWFLSYTYLVGWSVGERRARWIASSAALLTNPAWAIGLAPLLERSW